MTTHEEIIECPVCRSMLGMPEPGWSLEHHPDGSHTAQPPLIPKTAVSGREDEQ